MFAPSQTKGLSGAVSDIFSASSLDFSKDEFRSSLQDNRNINKIKGISSLFIENNFP
jgi:hypothetical protein